MTLLCCTRNLNVNSLAQVSAGNVQTNPGSLRYGLIQGGYFVYKSCFDSSLYVNVYFGRGDSNNETLADMGVALDVAKNASSVKVSGQTTVPVTAAYQYGYVYDPSLGYSVSQDVPTPLPTAVTLSMSGQITCPYVTSQDK